MTVDVGKIYGYGPGGSLSIMYHAGKWELTVKGVFDPGQLPATVRVLKDGDLQFGSMNPDEKHGVFCLNWCKGKGDKAGTWRATISAYTLQGVVPSQLADSTNEVTHTPACADGGGLDLGASTAVAADELASLKTAFQKIKHKTKKSAFGAAFSLPSHWNVVKAHKALGVSSPGFMCSHCAGPFSLLAPAAKSSSGAVVHLHCAIEMLPKVPDTEGGCYLQAVSQTITLALFRWREQAREPTSTCKESGMFASHHAWCCIHPTAPWNYSLQKAVSLPLPVELPPS